MADPEDDRAQASLHGAMAGENTYVMDVEDAVEMGRLVQQDRLLTEHTGGLFPEGLDLSAAIAALDLACGPGGWALQVAQAYPQLTVTGVDISERMIHYAQAQAVVQQATQARFLRADIRQPLPFPDASFDLVNARLLLGALRPTDWAPLLDECRRVLRPGGVVRLTEAEYAISNSPAAERISGLFTTALARAGQSFSPDGRHIGITPMLGKLVREAGFERIQQRASFLDTSFGAEAHASAYQDSVATLKLMRPFLYRVGVTTPEEIDPLIEQAFHDLASEHYRAIAFFLTTWGTRA